MAGIEGCEVASGKISDCFGQTMSGFEEVKAANDSGELMYSG